MKGKSGFTLIELLVVIAIIAVLMSILLPSLSLARIHAKRIASSSNLRQIGVALELYAQDNRGFFPETSHSLYGQASWIFTLSPYIGDVNEVRVDPADPKYKERLIHPSSSYVMNEYIAMDDVNPFGQVTGPSFRNKYELKWPAQTITTFVGADSLPATVSYDHTHSRSWFQPSSVPWDAIRQDIQPDRYSVKKNEDNTIGSSLYLYADGRVEKLQAQAVKDMADRGEDFSKPPDR